MSRDFLRRWRESVQRYDALASADGQPNPEEEEEETVSTTRDDCSGTFELAHPTWSILGWHHFYDRSTTAVALLSNGLLHATELIVIVAAFGVRVVWRAERTMIGAFDQPRRLTGAGGSAEAGSRQWTPPRRGPSPPAAARAAAHRSAPAWARSSRLLLVLPAKQARRVRTSYTVCRTVPSAEMRM
jgi:hypothetical protein